MRRNYESLALVARDGGGDPALLQRHHLFDAVAGGGLPVSGNWRAMKRHIKWFLGGAAVMVVMFEVVVQILERLGVL